MNDREKYKATETAESPECGTSAANRELLTVPDARRLLRAYGGLDDNARQSIVNLLENIRGRPSKIASRLPFIFLITRLGHR